MYLSGSIGVSGKRNGSVISDEGAGNDDQDGLGDPKLNLNIEMNKKANRKKKSEEWIKKMNKVGFFRHMSYRINTLEKGIKTLQNLRNVIKKNREELYITSYTVAGTGGKNEGAKEEESKIVRKRHRSFTPSSVTQEHTNKQSSSYRKTNASHLGEGNKNYDL